ncbi:unnamed protein product [Darwinula stevensoni]|uniref:Protein white n=1 Tax=Darwinula stevensoni TaxID=69355 RepID=A0A7R8WYX9_9CRUS|nr:unnamed protein product [Darwinula stevensoni]CAG0879464.1 unnamed protein product [Darwinula stevensoni]
MDRKTPTALLAKRLHSIHSPFPAEHPSIPIHSPFPRSIHPSSSSSLSEEHPSIPIHSPFPRSIHPSSFSSLPSRRILAQPLPAVRVRPPLCSGVPVLNGIACPGELLAIMGASGAGKTTLLNVMTSRNLGKLNVSGKLMVNGKTIKRSALAGMSAYVQQEDLFIGTLTALLRMDKEITLQQRIDRVEEVILDLGLSKCSDTIIGVPGRIRGISGGERKRLSIASEVLTDPPLLFCDEPTSGLDSFMAQQVVALMKSLAVKGKTVISTIHQPSSEVYSLFDRILFMAEGRIAFMGKADFAISFFQGVGYECPPNYNPGDFFIKTLAVVPGEEDECRRRVARICDAFRDSEEGRAMEKEVELQRVDGTWNDPGEFKRNVRSKGSWFAQFRTILARSWTANLREPLHIKLRILQTVAVAVMLGILYLRQDLTAEGVMNINGALFLFLMISTYQNFLPVIYVFCEDLPIFLREQRSGLYRADAYYLGKTTAELPFFVVFPAAFTAIAYYLIGLDPERFLVCLLVMVAVANVCCSFGYMMSCIASSVEMVLALAPSIMMPIMMLSGFFLNNDSVPSYLIWVKYISWFYYGNEILMINQWKGVEKIECGESFACPRNGDEVIASLNFDKDNELRDWLMLLVLMMAFRIIGVLVLHIRASRRK